MRKYIILLNEGPIYNEGTLAEWQKPSGHISGKHCLLLLEKIMQIDPLVQLEFTKTDRRFRGWIKNKKFKSSDTQYAYFSCNDTIPCLLLELSEDDEELEEAFHGVLDTLLDQEIIFAVEEK